MKPPTNPQRLVATLRSLEAFVNDALGLTHHQDTLTGFDYVDDLLEAAYANSYIETVGRHADSIHKAILRTSLQRVAHAYIHRAQVVGKTCELADKDVVLAFDYTEEDYYGKLDSPWLHTWTGEHAVKGKWKFLTCSIVNRDGPPKVPVLSIPTPVGYDMAKQVRQMVELVRPLVKRIRLCLFDRGFYSRPLMKALDDLHVPYLIFVPRTKKVRAELDAMQAETKKTIRYEFEYEKDKTTHRGQTNLALLRQVFDPRRKKPFDWAFATNVDDFDLDVIVPQYKGRWRIETGFRVQDQADIQSTSKLVEIRYFYFAFEQALQFVWGALYKDEVPYKRLIQELVYASHARLERASRSATRTGPSA